MGFVEEVAGDLVREKGPREFLQILGHFRNKGEAAGDILLRPQLQVDQVYFQRAGQAGRAPTWVSTKLKEVYQGVPQVGTSDVVCNVLLLLFLRQYLS